MFKRDKSRAVVQPPSDPYTAAKHEFNEVYGHHITQARNWRAVAIVSIVIALVSVIALGVRATQSRFIPYVVEVDKFGSVAAAGRADVAEVNDPRVLRGYLRNFIKNVRLVSFDPAVGKAAVDQTFQFIADNTAAREKLSEYFSQNNPLTRGQTESVQADDASITILRVSDKVWQITWVEVTRDASGQVRNRTNWKGVFTLAFNPPADEAQIPSNPLGLFITDFDWRQESAR